MRFLRRCYRWQVDVFDGLSAAMRRWPVIAVAWGAAVLVILQTTNAPVWLRVCEGVLIGMLIFIVYTED